VEYTLTANDREKYATYTRDSSGLDYAVNRYYSSVWGRFLSPDPYVNSAGPGDPGSWNRYSYTRGDPVNRLDPGGLDDCPPGYVCVSGNDGDSGYGAGGAGGGGLIGCSDTNPFEKVSGGNCNVPSKGGSGNPIGVFYAVDAHVLATLARRFAQALLSENFSADCAGDIAALGITPEQWAGALDNVSVLNGIGSQASLASALTDGSAAQQIAQSKGMTVGQTFLAGSSGSLQVAMASVNGPQVWINPLLVNPGNAPANSGLIAHETLHNLGLLDPTIQQDLGIPVTNNTVNISNRLQQDCFPGPPGTVLP
jgi:RHS repeat-associated protein